jgi:hypothetical protein
MSSRGPLTCDDASRLARCHRALVSNSCHFFRTPQPVRGRHTQSLRDADKPIQNVPSRDQVTGSGQSDFTSDQPRPGLGRVSQFSGADAGVNDCTGQEDAAEVGQGVFVVAGRDAAPLLEPVEAAFDGVAQPVDSGVESGRATAG